MPILLRGAYWFILGATGVGLSLVVNLGLNQLGVGCTVFLGFFTKSRADFAPAATLLITYNPVGSVYIIGLFPA